MCKNKLVTECSLSTLESEWKQTNVTVISVSPEARVPLKTEGICGHLEAEYASLELHVHVHEETLAFKEWLLAKYSLE